MKTLDLFPVSISLTKLGIDPAIRQKMVDEILKGYKKTKPSQNKPATWTGDRYGLSSLHQNKIFAPLIKCIYPAIKEHFNYLGYDDTGLQMRVTRCWATVGLPGQSISAHNHLNSHLSLSYYPDISARQASLRLYNDANQNIFIPGMNSPTNLLERATPNEALLPHADVALDEDVLAIFPSQVRHGVSPHKLKEPRLSIAMDTIFTLKSEDPNEEHFLPPMNTWKTVN